MKGFAVAEILHLFNIKTTDASKVYDAITTQEGLSNWWTTETTATPEVNSIATFRFLPDYYDEMKITKLEKNRRVEWHCIVGDKQWVGTKIIFSIEPEQNSINLRFSHTDWREKTDFYAVCNYHWGLYMKSLKTYVETGKGNPHIFK
jgi:uncharacterized protein YndB with AHSA1/START domain